VKRKIGVLHILPSVRGYGAERIVIELLRRLESDRIEPSLLTIYETPASTRDDLNFPVANAGRNGRRDRLFLWKVVREIRRRKPDVVHTHTHVGKYWGRLAALLAGTRKIVHTEHNPCDFRRSRTEHVADWLLHRFTSRVVTFFREQGTALVEFEGLPERKLVLIPNGLTNGTGGTRAAARDRLGLRSDQFAIVLIGRMEYQKNHILALRAFAALDREVAKNCYLFFAGSGDQEIVLRGLSEALNVSDRVRFLGYRNDVAEILPGMDLLLMTSWFEGMPLALIEAMLAGVPIVSTPWLGARSMLADGRYGFLTAGFDPLQVAVEMERAIAHPSIRLEMAKRAKQHVGETYDLSNMVEAHHDMYLELCGAS